jgi:hypothetical protein
MEFFLFLVVAILMKYMDIILPTPLLANHGVFLDVLKNVGQSLKL